MDLVITHGWRPNVVRDLVRNISPRDREECRFHTTHLESHIAELVDTMGNDIVQVTDERDRLLWVGGIAPSLHPDLPFGGFAWLLKTKFAKPSRKAERAVMRAALKDVIQLAVDTTVYTRIGNIIWDQQKQNIRWLQSEGFTINWDNPGEITRPNGTRGIFYQFWKELRR